MKEDNMSGYTMAYEIENKENFSNYCLSHIKSEVI